MFYIYFMKNVTYPFPTLKVCKNPIFNIAITIQIRPSTWCSSSAYDVPTPPPPSSPNRTPVLPPLLPPCHHFYDLYSAPHPKSYPFRGGEWSTHILLLLNSSSVNPKWKVHLALSTYRTLYASYFSYDRSTDIE